MNPASKAMHSLHAWFMTLVVCVVAVVSALPLLHWFEPTNIAMLFLLVVLLVSYWWGRKSGLISVVLLVAAFDFFFVKPYFTFAVSDAQYLVTFVVMALVAMFISSLVSQLRDKQQQAQNQADQTRALYDFSKDLIRAMSMEQVGQTTTVFIQQQLGFEAFVMESSSQHSGRLVAVDQPNDLRMVEIAAAEGLFQQNSTDANANVQIDAFFEDEGQSSMYVLLEGATRSRGVLLVRTRGQAFHIMRHARPILDAVASMVAIAIDRLHYFDVANEHKWQVESERLRGSILVALSHDIRTPLTAMYGVADGLHWIEPKPSAQVLDAADKLCEQSMQLNQMITHLLDYTKLQTEHMHIQREWVPLDEVIGSSMHSLVQPLRDVRVVVDVPEILLNLDPVLFERVLANVLDNAIKFNANSNNQSEKLISIQARQIQGETDQQCVISISNPSPHLSAHQISDMFMLFERLGTERTQWGTGLGLAICRSIMDAHQGRIWAENTTLEGKPALSVHISLKVGTPPQWTSEADDESSI